MNTVHNLFPATTPTHTPHEIMASDAAASINSREIAELVNSRHDDVKRSIGRLANQKVIEFPPTAEIRTATKPVTVHVFSGEQGKRDSIVVVAQLSPQFTARLVDRWQELEAKVRQPAFDPNTVLNDPAAMRGFLLAYTEKVIALEAKVEEQAPKVEALNRIASADGSLCMRDSAKVLQIRPIDLKNWLLINRWIYGRPGHSGWLGYQDKIQSGLLCHKVHTKVEADGNERTFEQVRITSKGLTSIGESLSRLAA